MLNVFFQRHLLSSWISRLPFRVIIYNTSPCAWTITSRMGLSFFLRSKSYTCPRVILPLLSNKIVRIQSYLHCSVEQLFEDFGKPLPCLSLRASNLRSEIIEFDLRCIRMPHTASSSSRSFEYIYGVKSSVSAQDPFDRVCLLSLQEYVVYFDSTTLSSATILRCKPARKAMRINPNVKETA